MYADSPSPGIGFVTVMVLLLIGLVVLPILFRHRLAGQPAPYALVVIACVGGAAVLALVVHAAYNTEYEIGQQTLYVRNGCLLRGEYSLGDIRDVTPVGLNIQTFGSALRLRGYCNRFLGGVRILAGDNVLYVSPSNPARFVEELSRRTLRLRAGI